MRKVGAEQRKQATWAGSRVARLGLSSEGWNNRGLGWSEASTVVATGRRRSVRVPGTHCLAGPQLTQTAAPQSWAAVLSSSSPYQGLPNYELQKRLPGKETHPGRKMCAKDFSRGDRGKETNLDFEFPPPWPMQIKSRTTLHNHAASSSPMTHPKGSCRSGSYLVLVPHKSLA